MDIYNTIKQKCRNGPPNNKNVGTVLLLKIQYQAGADLLCQLFSDLQFSDSIVAHSSQ